MRLRLLLPLLGLALIISLAYSQPYRPFLQGRLATSNGVTTLSLDSDHSTVRITNPEAVRSEKDQKVVLHILSTKDGIRVISSASIDDQEKPDDFSFAAIVAERKDTAMVERLLQLGANPNAKTHDGIRLLLPRCPWATKL